MTDEEIVNHFFTKDKGILYTKKYYDFEKSHNPNEYYEYLLNRFKDSLSIKESLYRIRFNYIERPKCKVCGNPVRFTGHLPNLWNNCCSKECTKKYRMNSIKETNLEKYGVECTWQSNKVKEKIKNSNLEKYGVEHPQTLKEIKDKVKNTCNERYGGDNPMSSESIREKSKISCKNKYGVSHPMKCQNIIKKNILTCIYKYGVSRPAKLTIVQEKTKETCRSKYGTDYAWQSNKVKEKIKETCKEKYGVDNVLKSKEIKEKIKETCKEKYGVEYFCQSSEFKDYMKENYENIQCKINNTKKRNHTFNSSKIEDELYSYIKEKFPDIKRQYRDKERYPYNCDFYIPSLDYFIELQGHWTHGEHPYNSNSIEDQNKVEKWKSKHKRYYDLGIKCWTIKDVEKRECAKKHNLNFKEVWSLKEGKEFVDTIFNKSKDS